ncbi:MAG: hypothetical protein ETSY2_35300 [Candidatus Entotheonella gemina]|uniref:Uncharacterized protein n=1 Tax=Candidatus Entotheonella gemina TaxID=1429439 RepID=W4LXT9_9BACT|nr:MAG: hypothetical protein ETSY2_35300 [Candidatus Entotheonella gemina]
MNGEKPLDDTCRRGKQVGHTAAGAVDDIFTAQIIGLSQDLANETSSIAHRASGVALETATAFIRPSLSAMSPIFTVAYGNLPYDT